MCVDTSRDTGPVTGITLNWYRDGIRLQRQRVGVLTLSSVSIRGYGMQTQWLLRECFSVILEGELHLKQLSQLVSTIPVSVGM